MSRSRQWILKAAPWLLMAAGLSASDPAPRSASVPQAVAETAWIRQVGAQQQQLANQQFNVCFIGDSLTEFWLHTGAATWKLAFAPLKAVNLGMAADRTEHVLHRILSLDFRRAKPRAIVLMMGTNNLGMQPPDPPEEVVKAIEKAILLFKQKAPAAQVIILGLPPSGQDAKSLLAARVLQTNALLAQNVWPPHVTYIPVHDLFVDDAGNWLPGLTLDGTHFSPDGYALLASRIGPALHKVLYRNENSP